MHLVSVNSTATTRAHCVDLQTESFLQMSIQFALTTDMASCPGILSLPEHSEIWIIFSLSQEALL